MSQDIMTTTSATVADAVETNEYKLALAKHLEVDVSTVEGTPNIDGIADVMFHIQRLGGSVAVDPSLLGFGELLSGGLGDGGFFRVSALAASISQSLKTACMNAIEQLFNLHIALKYKKYYPPGQRPTSIRRRS